MAWAVVMHTTSNAITLCRRQQLIGNGAGQMSRVRSCQLAIDLARDNGHDIVIGGGSAGGGLTLALLASLADEGLPYPAGAIPISPWADLSCSADTWTTKAGTDMILAKERLTEMAALYAQGADLADPRVSPVNADYSGFPPLYIQASGRETLLDDALDVARVAANAGVDVRLDVFPEMQHVFQYCTGTVPEADAAVAELGAWVRRCLAIT